MKLLSCLALALLCGCSRGSYEDPAEEPSGGGSGGGGGGSGGGHGGN